MREKKIYCGKHYREVDIYPYTAAQLTASTRGKRSKKIKETEPKQKNLNDKNARRYFTQTANLNFGSDPEALHVTATYSGKYLPDTVEQAEQEATNFLRRVQYHLHNWDPADDERMMMAIYYAEQVHPFPRYKNDLVKFKADWAAQAYDPGGASLTFAPADVEELEVLCEEATEPEPPAPPAPKRKKHKRRRK